MTAPTIEHKLALAVAKADLENLKKLQDKTAAEIQTAREKHDRFTQQIHEKQDQIMKLLKGTQP